jgi:16S rRNA processing protein RimM
LTDDRIAIGIIRTSFGVKGELKVKSFSGEVKHFLSLKEVFLKDKGNRFLLKKVENVRSAKDDLIMKLEGIDTPELGKTFSGTEIWVSRKDASPLGSDEYYLADLCRCTAYIGVEKIGVVRSLIEGSSSDLLEVVRENGQSLVVPFLDEYVDRVSIEESKIYLRELVLEL